MISELSCSAVKPWLLKIAGVSAALSPPAEDTKALGHIMKSASISTSVSIFNMKGRRRFRPYVRARWIYFSLAHELSGCPLTEIAGALNRDHTTALHAINCMRDLLPVDSSLREKYDNARRILNV